MKLALGTNAYRALDDDNRQLIQHITSSAQIGMPVIVLGELYHDKRITWPTYVVFLLLRV
jgi:predicted nucleic acid-binding protein